jgi:hypothetical protein
VAGESENIRHPTFLLGGESNNKKAHHQQLLALETPHLEAASHFF